MSDAPLALGEYKVGKRIARGGFGYVHLGTAPDGREVAIKYERTNDRVQRPYLQHEAEVYRLLEGHSCVPKIYAFGREGRRNIMVFDLLGPSLETLLEECGGSFSLKTMLMLAPQIIDAIEYCHSKGIIHRDLKPDNLLMGLDDRAKFVHIIDFGLARRFRHPRTLEHFPYFDGHSFFGTTRFASLQALEGCSQSRRDDLESAAYSLIYFVRKRLPWQGLRGGTEKHRDQRVREKKKTWTPKRLCEGLPGGEELSKMLEHVKSLGYTDKPDYAYLKDLFRERFEKEGFVLDYDYDWLHLPEREDQSVVGSEMSSRVGMSAQKTSAHTPGADHKVANSESSSSGPPINNKGVSGSVHGESVKRRSELPPIMTSRGLSELKLVDIYGSKAKKRDNQGSAGSKNASARSSHSLHPSSTGSRRAIKDLPVQAGDLVLIKFLARPTLEWGDLGSDSKAPTDTSYWHNPSLSKDEWHFPFRPAIVQNVHFTKPSYTKLTVLPIMQRSDGLDNVPPSRRPAFIKINSDGETAADKPSGDDKGSELNLTPTWPRKGTYAYFLRDDFDIQVPTEAINDIEVIWHLDREQLKALHRERENIGDAFKDDSDLSEAGRETNSVRRRQALRPGRVKYTLFGDIASLTEESFGHRPDVEVKGSNGWLPEFHKVDRRRNHENGHYTDDTVSYSSDEEDISFTSEGPPGNRRLSCTLAIDGDVIVEAASQDGSEHGSRYRSPRISKTASISSRGSSRRRTASSSTGSVARSPRSLRHAVLDPIPRSRLNSPVLHDRASDSDINRDSSTGIDTDSSPSRVNSESGVASSLTLSSSQPSLDDSESHERSTSDLAPFSSSNESQIGSSSDSFATRTSSIVSSRSCSCSESYISSDVGSGSVESAGVNKLASLIEGKLMVDRGIQTDDINEEASEALGKVMVNKGVQTRA